MEIDKITKMYFEGEVVGYDITYVNSNFKKSVPINEDNTDYQAIQEWIEDGGTVIDNGGGE
jgi:acid stress-induced BolA-like protein IbaG/YrbA